MNKLVRPTAASIALTVSMFLSPVNTDGCSRVLWNNNGKAVVTGRTMDWSHSWDDMVFVYPRGQKMDGGVEGGLQWTSKYGSVGCSISPYASKKYGFDLVKDGHTDGINEKGLAVHLLYLEETVYPDPRADDRPAVTFMRWVRFILDNHASVQEAVAGMRKIRIEPVSMGGKIFGTHVAIEDPSGDSAIFEFIDGNLVIHHGKKYSVMTNDPSYPFHVENMKNYKDLGGQIDLPGTTDSVDRFVRLAHYLGRLKQPKDDADALAKIYSVIKTAHVPFDADEYGPTWWTSLTDCTNKVWYFDWSQNPNIIWVDLKKLDFSEGNPVRQINPRNPAMVGDVTTAFEPVETI